jgi:MoaA/NifB/PqqE/SkfB family radical SAM enzyme
MLTRRIEEQILSSVNTPANTALPENLRDAVRIAWHISSWCNYSCGYCGVLVYRKRAAKGERQAHAFDYQPVERWLEVLGSFPQREIYLKITGGEPFLDRVNLRQLLLGLNRMPQYALRIDTNGTWDPEYFREIDKQRIHLNISYHPGEVDFEAFLKRIMGIRTAGFQVTNVNFVMAPENIETTEKVLARLEKEGFFVNVSAMMPLGIYSGRKKRTSRELQLLENYNTPVDLHYRLIDPPTKDRLCYHPAISYYILYDGSIKVACSGTFQNVFTDGAPPLPRSAVPCPLERCDGCVEMFRALVDEPLLTRPYSLYPLTEYAEEVKAYRKSRRWKTAANNLRYRVSKRFAAAENGHGSLIPVEAIKAASSDGAATEFVGELDGGPIDARSRDRVAVSGWAASRALGPVREVSFQVEGHSIGVVRDFSARPEIAERYQRPDLMECGWRVMLYLPALSKGTHQLVAHAVAPDGTAADLPPLEVRIIE